ncbi:PEP/pyruvate-binding domain-containing protein [Streptomyces sp. NPDC014646]
MPFGVLGRGDVPLADGKNASPGEMISRLARVDVRVPPGFATTADAYQELLHGHGLRGHIEEQSTRLRGGAALHEVGGAAIGPMIMAEPLPAALSRDRGPRRQPTQWSGGGRVRRGRAPWRGSRRRPAHTRFRSAPTAGRVPVRPCRNGGVVFQ